MVMVYWIQPWGGWETPLQTRGMETFYLNVPRENRRKLWNVKWEFLSNVDAIYRLFFATMQVEKIVSNFIIVMECQNYIQRWIGEYRKSIYFVQLFNSKLLIFIFFISSNLENINNGFIILGAIGN